MTVVENYGWSTGLSLDPIKVIQLLDYGDIAHSWITSKLRVEAHYERQHCDFRRHQMLSAYTVSITG